MSLPLVLIITSLAGTLFVLITGLLSLGFTKQKDSARFGNKMMRLRILLQAICIALLILAFAL